MQFAIARTPKKVEPTQGETTRATVLSKANEQSCFATQKLRRNKTSRKIEVATSETKIGKNQCILNSKRKHVCYEHSDIQPEDFRTQQSHSSSTLRCPAESSWTQGLVIHHMYCKSERPHRGICPHKSGCDSHRSRQQGTDSSPEKIMLRLSKQGF